MPGGEGASLRPSAPMRSPQSVLFACAMNSVRSPMAEAIARHFFGHRVYFASAGIKRGELDPFAVAVMDEMGIDIGKHKPHTFEDLEDASFDLIVSLCPEAHHKALEFTRTLAIDVVYWPTVDPSAVEGSRERVLDAYRNVRDGLIARINALFDYRPAGNL
jgi:protein-tyrosine-phosphatase